MKSAIKNEMALIGFMFMLSLMTFSRSEVGCCNLEAYFLRVEMSMKQTQCQDCCGRDDYSRKRCGKIQNIIANVD